MNFSVQINELFSALCIVAIHISSCMIVGICLLCTLTEKS